MTRNIIRVLIIVVIILLIPLIFTIRDSGISDGWKWSPMDFVTMGALLFVTGLVIDYIVRKFTTILLRVIAIIVVIAIFLAIWVELAVGGISQLINFFYI